MAAIGIVVIAEAQVTRTPATVGYTEFGAYSTRYTDAFAFTGNQAALAHIQKPTAGVYSERRFMLQELSLYQLTFALPTSTGNFGLATTYFGRPEYNETEFSLAYGRKLSDKISIGTQFNYYNIIIAGYGKAAAVNVEAGMLFKMTDQLNAGFHLYNPTKSKIGKQESERLPFIYEAGLGYEATENFFITATIEKAEHKPINIKTGMQFKVDDKLLARGGIETANSGVFFGAGVFLNSFRLDVLASVHPQLGFTPALLLIYCQPDKQ
jgi:Type IX secretion system membrane protein PorP/SprF